jgi:hypothetical protein
MWGKEEIVGVAGPRGHRHLDLDGRRILKSLMGAASSRRSRRCAASPADAASA